ncbi:Six-hairpin glycosidase-like protein [Halenospora varia]|nr:Six-hairpin glycosidase-like protein [Halenospora varia]
MVQLQVQQIREPLAVEPKTVQPHLLYTSAPLFDVQPAKDDIIQELFAQNAAAKIWRVAKRDLKNNIPPKEFPEFVPQDGPNQGRYVLREADFWTCGFFPGSLYTLLEREAKYTGYQQPHLPREPLLALCRAWSEPLHAMANRTDTHDIGFIVMPALRSDWELTGNRRSLESIITAAYSLASRFNATAKSIRSWDLIRKKDVVIISMEENFILIIDSLCNLDLLFYASAQTGDATLATIASTHARTLLRTHLRPASRAAPSRTGYSGPIFSTCHVANVDPRTGAIKAQMTAQGHSNESTWARGQAWAILGYAQTYIWTKERIFLDAACGCAEYFLQRLGTGYKVPAWDFDAPVEDSESPVLDSSAGAIAANGMLLISEALATEQQLTVSVGFRDAAIGLVRALLQDALAEKAKFVVSGMMLAVEDVEVGATFDGILKDATANNNAGANRRYRNHGLVYADYYLLQFGNQLLRMRLA